MITLNNNDILTAYLGEATTTTEPYYSITYGYIADTDPTKLVEVASTSGNFNGTTEIELLSTSDAFQLDVKYFHIHNSDTIEHSFTLEHGGGKIYRCTLEAGGSATYSTEWGWIVYNSRGEYQQGFANHASNHENGGVDEISVAGLSGLLADEQDPLDHASDHENGGGDEINVAGLSGELADPQPPKTHASTHIRAGSDEIDGDKLDIDWNPTNYTPSTSPAEADHVDNLTAHLAGIDDQIGGILGYGGTPTYIRKTSDQANTDTTLSNVNDMSFSLVNGNVYSFRFVVVAYNIANAAAGLSLAITHGGASQFAAQVVGPDGSGIGIGHMIASGNKANFNDFPVSGSVRYVWVVEGQITPNADSTLQLQFSAQSTDSGNNVRIAAGTSGTLLRLA